MAAEVARYKESGAKLPITKFIKSAVKERLLMNGEYVQAGVWGEALALLARPHNIPESVGYLQQLSDDIWHRAGDTSADLNWYSKRMLLAGIVSSTEVFMIQDLSQNFEETWKFMDRRFEDISGIPQLGNLPQDVSGILSGLVTTARNIAGIQK
jgi:ubiquinone biosynthesis protein COQ9